MRTLEYLFARKERIGAMWSGTFQASDVAHLFAAATTGEAGDPDGPTPDPVAGMLRFLGEAGG